MQKHESHRGTQVGALKRRNSKLLSLIGTLAFQYTRPPFELSHATLVLFLTERGSLLRGQLEDRVLLHLREGAGMRGQGDGG